MAFRPSAPAPAPDAPLCLQQQWLAAQPLAFGNDLARWRLDSDALAEEIGLTVNLTRFESRRGSHDFAHRAAFLLAGDIAFSASTYVPLVASTGDYSESTLEIPYFGSTRFRLEGKDWFDRAGQQALYLPGQSCEVETGHFNGLLFNLNPQRLAAMVGVVSRHRVPLELADRWVQQPVPIDLNDPRVIQLQARLETGLQALVQHNGLGLGDPQGAMALELETLAYRCSAGMILVALG